MADTTTSSSGTRTIRLKWQNGQDDDVVQVMAPTFSLGKRVLPTADKSGAQVFWNTRPDGTGDTFTPITRIQGDDTNIVLYAVRKE